MHNRSASTRHRWFLLPLAIATTLVGFLLASMGGHAGIARADDVRNVDVVVQFDATSAVVRPITFTGAISGLRALELTGLEVISTVTAFGPAICSIGGVGCPAEDCFCNPTNSWGYSFWDGAAWQSYPVGASSSVVSQTGAVEGWRWGEFTMTPLPADQARAAATALDWLASGQQADGGYGTPGATADVMLAIGANDLDAAGWMAPGGASLLDYWTDDAVGGDPFANNAAKFVATSPGSNAKLLLAARATGQDVHSFAGVDLAGALFDSLDPSSGVIGQNNWDQALGILALRTAITASLPVATIDVLAARVGDDGGWGYIPGGDSDTNTTAVVLQALHASGLCSYRDVLASAASYLQATQNTDGGFPYAAGGLSDSNSTAFVLQAILALGEDPHGARWMEGGKSAVDFLLARQLADGSFEWQAGQGSNEFATRQAIPPLLNASMAPGAPSTACFFTYLPLLAQ